MPDPLRRSGSATVLLFPRDGVFPVPDPGSDEFTEKLSKNRFRTIESAASEETATGWVTPGDPSGASFSPEDMEGGRATWLRMRIDKKQIPTAWLQIHKAAQERAVGRKLSPTERRELKADLAETRLPGHLPKVTLVDALLVPKEQMVVVLSSSAGALEAFGKLFFATFGITPEPADPYRLAYAVGLPKKLTDRLEKVAPVAWPVEEGGDA